MNMKLIFICEWNIKDYAGRREKSMKSKGTINGEHIYACKGLSSWFRLGKYLIKHDIANYLLGITELMSNREFHQDSVKWWQWNEEKKTGETVNCVDEIVKFVNMFYSGDEYIKTLLNLQDELVGYEKCYYMSTFYHINFNCKIFLKDKDDYQARLNRYIEIQHNKEKELKDKEEKK